MGDLLISVNQTATRQHPTRSISHTSMSLPTLTPFSVAVPARLQVSIRSPSSPPILDEYAKACEKSRYIANHLVPR